MSRLVGGGILRNGKSATAIKQGSGNADSCELVKGKDGSGIKFLQTAHLDGVAVDNGPVLLEVL